MYKILGSIIALVTICFLFANNLVAEDTNNSAGLQSVQSKEIEYVDLQSSEYSSVAETTGKVASTGAAKLKAELNHGKSKKEQEQERAWTMETKKEVSLSEIGKRMFQGLAFCLGVMFLVLAVIKRTKKGVVKVKSRCRIIEKMSLTAKSTLILIEIDGKQHALTVGSEQVQQVQLLQQQQQLPKNESRPVRREREGLELLCHIGNIF